MKKKVFSLMMTLVLAFMGLARAEVVQIGDGTTTTYVTPFNSLWGYSFVEQVYTANEIGTAGTITAISFNLRESDAAQTNAVDVFMKNVSRETFSSASDFEPVTASDMVFSGTVTFSPGWTTITLDTPFEYDGSSNLLIGMHEYTSGYSTRYFYYTSTANAVVTFHSDGVDPNPYDLGSYTGNKYTSANRANIQIEISAEGGSTADQLHVKYMDGETEIIDSLNLGVRPVGAWMEPFNFTMYTEGRQYTVTVLDFTPSDGLFSVEGEELPFVVSRTSDVNLVMGTNATEAGVIERQFVAITEGNRAAHIWPLVVEMYNPAIPDVVETAYDFGTVANGFSYQGMPSAITPTVLHNDYTLPFPEIPEGVDAVYKFTVATDMIINAHVDENASDGKVALYAEGFNGEGGPMATNNYTGLNGAGGGAAGAPFEVQIGEGTSTTGYFPFYTLYNYSIAENLYLATELAEAGVTTAPMTSLSWYATNAPGYAQQGITIWMANVDDEALTTTSHIVTGMTKVYTGAMTPAIGWNEFVFNEGTFSWDGHSNVLIFCQRNNGAWNSTVNWQATSGMNFTCQAYRYQDSGAYDATVANTMYTATVRPNIIMKGGNRERATVPVTFNLTDSYGDGWNGNYLNVTATDGTNESLTISSGYNDTYTLNFAEGAHVTLTWTSGSYAYETSFNVVMGGETIFDGDYLDLPFEFDIPGGSTPSMSGVSAGPVIENLAIAPGTYYLVASATQADYDVFINIDNMPCPAIEAEGFAFNPQPADNEDEIEPNSVTLRWMVPEYATGWRLIFGTTYHPEVGHPQTIIYPEDGSFTDHQMANSFTVRNLWNNTNYFWRVEFNNDACPEGVSSPVWGFTTHLNVPQNLTAVDYTVFDDETIVLNWNAIVDRTYRQYNVYRDGELIGNTQVNNIGNTTYTDGPLAYNMGGYTYYVTAVYDEGESAPSNTINVKVSGYGDVNGHVYEQDGTTGIAGATVTMTGLDEFGVNHTYNFQTNGQGYYSGHIYAGSYNGQAAKDGYQTIDAPVQGNPIAINYSQETSPIDYMLDENFDPVCTVIAEYYPDSLDPQSPYVKVYWGCGLPGEEIIEPFETGDFSLFDWQIDPAYPWSITTNNPYEGTYCMKSGGAGVANVVSNMTVTVNIPADGEMSFFGKISCENNWDYGYFYIDNQQMGSYSGAGNWAERKFPITAGDHTFQWRYTKDGSVNSNDDCFYVDYITFYKRPEPLGAGWHTFLEGEFNDALRSNVSDNPSFGYHYPTSITSQYNGFTLTKVSMFSDDLYGAVGGSYTVNIYQGGTAPGEGTLVSSQPVDLPVGLGQWVDWDLNTPVSVSGGQDLWVIYYVNQAGGMGYPAGMCNTDSNPNGDWWNGGNGWENYGGGVWTMRNYFTNRAGRTVVLGTDAEIAVAAVQGPKIDPSLRQFVKGDNTVTAESINPNAPSRPLVMAESNRAFSHYRVYRTDCYNDGPYTLLDEEHPDGNTVVLACELTDTIYIDVDWPDVAPGVYKWGVGVVYAGNRGEEIAGPITWSAPVSVGNATRDAFTYGFEGGLDNWTVLTVNAGEGEWVHSDNNPGGYDYTTHAHGGNGFAMCYSFVDYVGAFNTDSYLISPQRFSIANGSNINFWADNANDSYPESFSVCVATAANPTAADFVTVWNGSAKGNGGEKAAVRHDDSRYDNWRQHTVDLSAYAGQEVWIAFHDVNYDAYEVWIDDVTINAAGGSAPTPGAAGLQEPRESEIVWSNCLEKGMYLGEGAVDVTVLLNSADSPEGVTVTFTNYNEYEQELYPIAPIVLDETGYYAFDLFRKGDYQVKVEFDGYEPITEDVSIWDPTSLRYVMIEIIYGVNNLYVSSTGWAMWDAQGLPPTPGPNPGPGGNGDTFSENFDGGMPAGWTTVDADGDGLTWVSSMTPGIYHNAGVDLTGTGHNASTAYVISGSWANGTGQVLYPDNYLVSPQVNLAAGSTFSFWACAQDASYPADHFGVAISDNGTSDWTMVNEWTMTAKDGNNGVMSYGRDGDTRAQGNWYNYSVDLSAYAGQKYIAIRHFNCSDQFILNVDDIELTAGAKAGERHLEYFKVMCESLDHEPIFNADTEHPFCQVATDELVPGDHYLCKVAAVYSTGMSDWVEAEWQYIPCDNYAGTLNGIEVNGTTVSWDYPNGSGPVPPQPGQGDAFSVDFEAGLPAGWTVIDGNNDGWTWELTSNIPNVWTYYAGLSLDWYHNGANAICSGSYINGVGALNPDEYLVSPLVTIANGSTFSFYAAATDATYAADHFGVFVSDNGTSNWTMVNEWTLTAKGGAKAGDLRATRDGNGNRLGNWYNFSVDLSAYAGQKYIAIRHFNCSDQYIMCVDDVELTSGAKSNRDVVAFNGFVTDPGAMANGADASWIKGSQSTWGPNVNYGGGYMLADMFTINATTTISEIEVYGYQTGSSSTSTFTGLYAQIYNGSPMSGGNVVWGDANANIMTSTAFTNCYRGSDGETTATTRPIMSITASGLNIELEAGTYYLVYSLAGSGSSGPWGAPHAEPGIGNTGNGLQYTSTGWGTLLDSGAGTSYGCAMKISGSTGSGPTPPPATGEILGAMVFLNGEWEAFVPYPTNEYTYEEGGQYCVRMVYNGTNTLPEGNIYYSMSCPECEGGEGCAAGAPIYAEELHATDQVRIWWGDQPTPPATPVEDWLYYDDGANVDAIGLQNGGSFYWGIKFPANTLGQYEGCSVTKIGYFDYAAHTGTVRIYNGSAGNAPGTLIGTYNYTANGTEDWVEWNIPAVAFDNTQDLWIVMNNANGQWVAALGNYTGDPNGTMISTDGTTWYTLEDATGGQLTGTWNLRCFVTNQAKGGEVVVLEDQKNGTPNGVIANAGIGKQGHAPVYATAADIVKYNVYRSTDNANYTMIGEVAAVAGQTYYEYIDTPESAGTYYYQVRADYGDCESEPAVSGENPSQNYVVAGVDAVGENDSNVALFPNPTKGNVTIQAEGMSRVTVVSVLGQVVYDTELNADEFTLNMAQFNAGMYMVRVYTEEGVVVKRVTVMQ